MNLEKEFLTVETLVIKENACEGVFDDLSTFVTFNMEEISSISLDKLDKCKIKNLFIEDENFSSLPIWMNALNNIELLRIDSENLTLNNEQYKWMNNLLYNDCDIDIHSKFIKREFPEYAV